MSKERPSSMRMRFGILDGAPPAPSEKEMEASAINLKLKQLLKAKPYYREAAADMARDGMSAKDIIDRLMLDKNK